MLETLVNTVDISSKGSLTKKNKVGIATGALSGQITRECLEVSN